MASNRDEPVARPSIIGRQIVPEDPPIIEPHDGLGSTQAAIASRLTFFMVGAPRCGTTWTHAALHEHPSIYVPPKKQIHFFDENYARGLPWYLERYVDAEPCHRAVGEVSTDYSLPHAISRLARHFPNVKLVMSVRHPIERACSFYQSRAPHTNWMSFADAIDSEPETLQRGRYIEEIEEILKYFQRDRLLIQFFDDLRFDESGYIRSIFHHLNVDTEFRPSVIGNPLRAAMFPELRRRLKRVGLTPVVNLVNRSWMGDVVRRRHRTTSPLCNPIEPKLRQKLVDYYRPLNARLATLTGRDLAHWDC